MKIAVFADVHGNLPAMQTVAEICKRERADKTVFCGDLFGPFGANAEIVRLAEEIDSVLYFVRGNNDRPHEIALLKSGMDDYAVMYHFNRTLFFTHGDVYNKYRVPPVLKQDDAIIYGHTHRSLLQKYNGLFALNVGSVAYPRDGQACYLVLDDNGATLKNLEGNRILQLHWSTQ